MDDNCADASVSDWVRRFAELIPAGGAVLDLACGQGRHARFLASRGYAIEAVDRDAQAIAGLEGVGGITARVADIEGGPWPYYNRVFDGIVVTNFLFRPLFPHLISALAEGGVLIYETFMEGNEEFGRPSNPAYLLRSGELLEVVRRRLLVVAFEQGCVDRPRPAMIQRLCACRRLNSPLPESPPPAS
jgi:SAM-dependent methyltransferase